MSMGRGKTIVEFFSAEIVCKVWKREREGERDRVTSLREVVRFIGVYVCKRKAACRSLFDTIWG